MADFSDDGPYVSAREEMWEARWANIESEYADLVAYAKQTAPDREYMYPHCDSLVLHAPGECRYCDRYAATLQAFRLQREIAFTGHVPTRWGRPDPASRMRSLEKIERWYGNVPYVDTLGDAEGDDGRGAGGLPGRFGF